MQSQIELNKVAINLWTARVIPMILAGTVGYATYVLVTLLCGKSPKGGVGIVADMSMQSITF